MTFSMWDWGPTIVDQCPHPGPWLGDTPTLMSSLIVAGVSQPLANKQVKEVAAG